MSLNKMVKEKNELKDFNPAQVLHKQPKSFMCALKKSLVSRDHKAENANKMQTCILQGLLYCKLNAQTHQGSPVKVGCIDWEKTGSINWGGDM